MKKTYLIFAGLMLISLLSCQNKSSMKGKDIRLLIVHSYHIEYPWVKDIDDGIKETLKSTEWEIKTFFMDTKRKTSEEYKKEIGKKAMNIVETFKPQIVITSDDNAQKYFAKNLAGKDNISVVFCGVNADPKAYGYEVDNVTGIIERPGVRNTIALLKKILPNIKSYTLVTDKSPTSDGFIAYLKSLNLDIQLDIFQTNDYVSWKTKCNELTSDVLITYMYHTLKEGGKNVKPETVLSWTIDNVKKPSIGFFNFAIEGGVLLGNVESGYEHGQLASKRAMKIALGKKAGELPIIKASKGLTLVNEKTAKEININVGPLKNISNYVFQ